MHACHGGTHRAFVQTAEHIHDLPKAHCRLEVSLAFLVQGSGLVIVCDERVAMRLATCVMDGPLRTRLFRTWPVHTPRLCVMQAIGKGAKPKMVYVCKYCGLETKKGDLRCPDCGKIGGAVQTTSRESNVKSSPAVALISMGRGSRMHVLHACMHACSDA